MKEKRRNLKQRNLTTNGKLSSSKRGITLIALIVTIIIMLILVAVTISMAINGGLFNYGGKTVGETQNAIDAEQELANGRIKVGGIWYDSIDDYLNNKPSKNQGEGAILPEEGGLPDEIRVGDYVNYTPEHGTYTISDDITGIKEYNDVNSDTIRNRRANS